VPLRAFTFDDCPVTNCDRWMDESKVVQTTVTYFMDGTYCPRAVA